MGGRGRAVEQRERLLRKRRIVSILRCDIAMQDSDFTPSFLWRYVAGIPEVYKWTGKNDYVALCEPDFISFGGGSVKQLPAS